MLHIVQIMANNSSVPYFKWFADEVQKHKEVKLTFIAMYPERPQMLDDMAERGCDCIWVKFDSSNRKSEMIKAMFSLIKIFKKLKPDVVHTHLFDDSLPGLLAARIAGVKKRVITKQDTTYHWYYAPKWVWADRFNNFNATHIHAVATENKKFILEKEKPRKEKVHLVRNGFPYDLMTASKPEWIEELRETYQMSDRIIVGTVARYIHWKGHHLIVEAAQKLVEKYPNLLFIWAGNDGGSGYKNELQNLIDKNSLQNNILMLGWIEREKMPSLYKCMDIYLHPAINEPFGFAISEALMNKIPIIAAPTGSVDLIKHLDNGYILKENNADDIIKALSLYLDNTEKIKQIAEKGHQHALEHLIFDKMWQGHLEMYNK